MPDLPKNKVGIVACSGEDLPDKLFNFINQNDSALTYISKSLSIASDKSITHIEAADYDPVTEADRACFIEVGTGNNDV